MVIEALSKSETTRIGPIELTWGGLYYWIARGPVPLAVAHELYEHPLGRRAIRVNGAWVCPPPQGNEVAWYTANGERVWSSQEEAAMKQLPPWIDEPWYRLGPIVFHDRPTEIGATPYVELYHIDGDDALALFESVLCKHGVDKAARPAWWEKRFGAAGATASAPAAPLAAPCDSDDAIDYLAALREGTLSDANIEPLAIHLKGCETCRILLAYMLGETHQVNVANIIHRIEQARGAVADRGETERSSR